MRHPNIPRVIGGAVLYPVSVKQAEGENGMPAKVMVSRTDHTRNVGMPHSMMFNLCSGHIIYLVWYKWPECGVGK